MNHHIDFADMEADLQKTLTGTVPAHDSLATFPESLADLEDDEDDELPSNGKIEIKELESGGKPTGPGVPNRPHPSLEFPPLYFALKRWPWLAQQIKPLYKLRWRLSYPLQKRLPFNKALRKVGIRMTWGEALLLMPFFACMAVSLFFTVVSPSIKASGKVARYGLIAAIVFSGKNSFVTLLLGMPFDRALFYHKVAGYTAFVSGLLHTWAFAYRTSADGDGSQRALDEFFSGSMNISGTVLMLLLTGIMATSLKRVRELLFEVFYYFHLVFVAGMIICAFFHSGILIPCLAFFTTGVDMFYRKVVMSHCRYPKKASIKVVSDSVLEISFPKLQGFDFNPGQYIYIAVPELSWFEFHPFSISSGPKELTVTLHIRKAGNWTSALHKLALTKSEISLLIEGPYGNLTVDLFGNDRYKHVVLVCGGIGCKCAHDCRSTLESSACHFTSHAFFL
jgi:predicted ferric reductase